jgi:hypothetical protein
MGKTRITAGPAAATARASAGRAGMRKGIGLAGVATAIATAAALALPAGPALASAHASSTVLPAITVAMNGRTVTVGGALQSGGVRVQAKVPAKHQAAAMFIRLNPGVTYGQFFRVFHSPAAADPNAVLAGIGSIVLNFDARPGTTTVQTSLRPGLYLGFDTEANNPENWPYTEFTVAAAASPAALPRPQATVAAIEFGFTGPAKLHRGELVRFANHGYLVHMIDAIQAKNLAGARAIARLLKAGKINQASKLAIGETGFLDPASHGALQQERISARAGYWVLACFMQTQDGRDHTQLGMERVIQIVK